MNEALIPLILVIIMGIPIAAFILYCIFSAITWFIGEITYYWLLACIDVYKIIRGKKDDD